jgi:flavin-binding protein dodecin
VPAGSSGGSTTARARFIFTAATRCQSHRQGATMSIVKVLEVIAESDKSFDDAAQEAVKQAAATVRGIKSIWIDNFSGVVEDDRIVRYRVNAKVSFLVEGHQ